MSDELPTSTHVYPPPMHASCELAVCGAYVKRAYLYAATGADQRLLAVASPDYGREVSQEMIEAGNAPQAPLDFYRGRPVHFGLMKDWGISVVLEAYGEKPPYLMGAETVESLTWDTIGGDVYRENVCVGSDSGYVGRTMVFFRSGGGYAA